MTFFIPAHVGGVFSYTFNERAVNSNSISFGEASTDRRVLVIAGMETPCRIGGVLATKLASLSVPIEVLTPAGLFFKLGVMGMYIAHVPEGRVGEVTFGSRTKSTMVSCYSLYGMSGEEPFDVQSKGGNSGTIITEVPAGGVLIVGGMGWRKPLGGTGADWREVTDLEQDGQNINVKLYGAGWLTATSGSGRFRTATSTRTFIGYDGAAPYKAIIGASFGAI